MGKPNHSFEKRRREIEKKKKQEAKRQRKLERKNAAAVDEQNQDLDQETGSLETQNDQSPDSPTEIT